MKKGQHKIPASLFKNRVNQKVQEELSKRQDINQDDFRRGYETASRDVTGLYKPKLEEKKQQLLDQAKRHQNRVEHLKVKIDEQAHQLIPLLGISEPHCGFLVKNSHTFWKWLSTWAFAAIGYVSIYGVPPEIFALVPEASQGKVTALLALLGFVGRFINQSKPKHLPPVSDAIKEDA